MTRQLTPQTPVAYGSVAEAQSHFMFALMKQPVVWLITLCPIGFAMHWWSNAPSWVSFCINLVALVPEAYLMGIATEELALHLGDRTSALMNASFGNLVEFIFVYLTLREGLTTVCIGTIVGSILGNHLVLLGLAFMLAGTAQRKPGAWNLGAESTYNQQNAINLSMMLIVASICTALPSMFASFQDVTPKHVMVLSRAISIFMLFSYLALVTYSMCSQEEHDMRRMPYLTILAAGLMLAISAAMTVVSSEIVVHTMKDFVHYSGLSQVFVGVVILPLMGDLAHGTAVYVAVRGNMELALNIAMMSAIQVALLVMPVAVFMGWWLEVPMSLNFRSIHSVALMGSALLTFAVTVDGKSNWLRGYMLMSCFAFIAALFFFMPDVQNTDRYVG